MQIKFINPVNLILIMKQVVLVRQDLKMPKGKMVAQSCHAAVEAVLCSDGQIVDEWLSEGGKKSVLKVTDRKELMEYLKKAKKEGLIAVKITDAGKTFFKKPTMTCGAVGPDKEEKIDKIVGHLKLL